MGAAARTDALRAAIECLTPPGSLGGGDLAAGRMMEQRLADGTMRRSIAVECALRTVPGVVHVSVSLENGEGRAEVKLHDRMVRSLLAAVEAVGFTAVALERD